MQQVRILKKIIINIFLPTFLTQMIKTRLGYYAATFYFYFLCLFKFVKDESNKAK